MKSVRYAVALVLILLGAMINMNPDLVDSKVAPGASDNVQDSNLVGLQDSEEWLVRRVAFPAKPYSES